MLQNRGVPELRRNPLDGQWVILAAERADRPAAFVTENPPATPSEVPPDCPFCPGHERETPPEVCRTGEGEPDTPGWRVRVVPNLYPIVSGEPRPRDQMEGPLGPWRFHDALPATGAHEVVVLSPDHTRTYARLDPLEAAEVFSVMRDRVRAHLVRGRRHVQALINHGRPAGASIEHPHTQLVAIDLVPAAMATEAEHIAAADRCPVCRAVDEDAEPAGPLVVAPGPAPAWCPWWSGTAYELMVAPVRHGPRVEDAEPDELDDVARSLRDALARLEEVAGDPPYNAVVHTMPRGDERDFHWHVHVWPKLAVQAGFEQGTGVLVNVLAPELAAATLRGELN